MERGDVLPSELFVRRLFEFCDWFYFRISQLIISDALIMPMLMASATWRTTGSITPNFFSTLKLFEIFLLLSEQGLFERTCPFSSDPFRLLHTFFDSVTLVRQGSFDSLEGSYFLHAWLYRTPST
ncbi:hypothetical protein TNCV_748011 [Trichonephila clavipes]|nr:hypothetical protein TNCV_748011 [Trichonephila clavipes]